MENILYGGPMPDDITDGTQSLGEYCVKKLKLLKDQLLLIHTLSGEYVTASELLHRSFIISNFLKNHGIRCGDRIGIISDNNIEFYYISLGVIFLGATVVPLNPILNEREIGHLLKLSQPTIVFTMVECKNKIETVALENEFIRSIIIIGDGEECETVASILNSRKDTTWENIECESLDINTNVAVILSSSGTTGLPKGVELTQRNMLAFFAIYYLEETEYNICTTPLTHLNGFFTLFRWATEGQKALIMPKFDEDLFLQCVEKYKIQSIFLPPDQLRIVATSTKLCNYNLSSWKYILNGSGPISDHIIDSIYKRTNVEKIRITYGLTESYCNCTQPIWSPVTHKSIGPLRAGVWGKIVDIETGKTLGANQTGEILLKSPRVMKGYVNDQKSTVDAFDKDGFLCTGDLGYYDENGEWYFVERLKELIKYNNLNISPSELEMILIKHPQVKDVCVVGLPNEAAGELPMAFIVADRGTVTEDELCQYLAQQVSPYKRLRGGIRFINEIPKNSMGKKLRRILRQRLQL